MSWLIRNSPLNGVVNKNLEELRKKQDLKQVSSPRVWISRVAALRNQQTCLDLEGHCGAWQGSCRTENHHVQEAPSPASHGLTVRRACQASTMAPGAIAPAGLGSLGTSLRLRGARCCRQRAASFKEPQPLGQRVCKCFLPMGWRPALFLTSQACLLLQPHRVDWLERTSGVSSNLLLRAGLASRLEQVV